MGERKWLFFREDQEFIIEMSMKTSWKFMFTDSDVSSVGEVLQTKPRHSHKYIKLTHVIFIVWWLLEFR